jgi:hypothetical protein
MEAKGSGKNRLFVSALCGLFLLGLGSCSDELAQTEHPTPLPTPVVPGEEGLSVINFSVGTADFEEESPDTRAAADTDLPADTVVDLGNGFLLTSSWTVEPKTRAAGTPRPIEDGTAVIMIVCAPTTATDPLPGTPLGYSLATVDAGNLSFKMPAEGNFTLVFLSENDTLELDPTHYINEATGSTPGAYYQPGESETFTFTTDYQVGLTKSKNGNPTPPDCMYFVLPDASASTLQGSTLQFKHLFSQVKVELKLMSPKFSFGAIEAGFYPRRASATLIYDNLAKNDYQGDAALLYNEVTDDDPLTGTAHAGTFFQRSATDASVTTWKDSVSFIPYMNPTTATDRQPYIYIKKLTFRSEFVDMFVEGKTIDFRRPAVRPLPAVILDTFGQGKKYTNTISVTRNTTPNNWENNTSVTAGTWAASNIYYNGTTLTFDQVGVGDTNPDDEIDDSGQKQGVFFKWGSLIGIAPTPATYNGNGTLIFHPTATSDGACSGYTQKQVSDYLTLADIKASSSMTTVPGGDGNAIYEVDDAGRGQWYGDICAYITGGTWRLPTQTELAYYAPGSAGSWSWTSDATTDGKFYKNASFPAPVDSNFSLSTPSSAGYNRAYGIDRVTETQGSGFGYMLPEVGAPLVILPASGLRYAGSPTTGADADATIRIGSHGYYWSSDHNGTDALGLHFTNEAFDANSAIPTSWAASARCIKAEPKQ